MLHLCVANLLVLGLYCPYNLGWLIVYQWYAGDALCRVRVLDAVDKQASDT